MHLKVTVAENILSERCLRPGWAGVGLGGLVGLLNYDFGEDVCFWPNFFGGLAVELIINTT